ncbi:MAG: carboxylesterase family protein [Pseudomonadaceae bacterium]|nr:carboxylesterase family protein [Pseudomonadaceae bacterium]
MATDRYPAKTRGFFALTALFALLVGCTAPEAEVARDAAIETLRNTPQGELVGYEADSGAFVYLGIPFAQPPQGNLRWRAPRAPQPWEGQLLATEFKSPCPQYGSPLGGASEEFFGKPMGSEDCLYLNVYAPASDDNKPKPVMLWIHGGGNTIGQAGFYDGSVLAEAEDVVVVTTQYRMGPFGWFSHPAMGEGGNSLDGSGNYGTLDLIAALQWIAENIDAFGGDASNVTIFGESAGARNVFSLMLSPQAKGLFHRAISQSGGMRETSVATAQNFIDDEQPGSRFSSNEMLLKFLVNDGLADDRASAKLRLADMSHEDIASYLRSKDTWEVFNTYMQEPGLLGPQNPRVISDGLVISTGSPLELFADPSKFNAVPLLIGSNRDEPKIFMVFDENQTRRLFGLPLWPLDADAYNLEAELGALAWKLRGVDRPAQVIAEHGGRVFAYRWDWDEEGSAFGIIDVSELIGAAHGLEIPFVFGWWDLGSQTPLLFHEDNEKQRLELSRSMMSYWANFARTGDPGKGSSGELPRWQPWSNAAAGTRTLLLDTNSDQGIRMSSESVSLDDILSKLAAADVSDSQRCEAFERTFEDQSDAWREQHRKDFCA